MRTIERNYRKNPHTANFLMTFHAAAQGLPSDLDESRAAEIGGEAVLKDLLDTVDVDKAVDRRSPRQIELMRDLHSQLAELDATVCEQAVEYTAKMTLAGAWTPGRWDEATRTGGNASRWIGNMITKVRELKAAQAPAGPAAPVTVPNGHYAVEESGTLKFFRLKNGRRPGFVFLDIQASDNTYGISSPARIAAIVAEIAKDVEGAATRYGQELGRCYRCNRTLTDEISRGLGIGPDCRSK